MSLSGRVMFISVHSDPLDTLGGVQSGGQNVYVRELVKAMDANGVAVDVFTHHANRELPESEPIGNHSSVIRLSAGFKGFLPKRQMFSVLPDFTKELVQQMKGMGKYALIHSNYWLSGWTGLQLQKGLAIPRVHTSHSLGTVRQQSLGNSDKELAPFRIAAEQYSLQTSDRVIATTPLEKDILMNSYAVSPNRIRLVPCGVDTEIFHPFVMPNLNDDGGKKTVLFVGRFEENKGLAVLLRSIAILKELSLPTSGLRLVIAGGDRVDLPPDAMSSEKMRYLEITRNLGILDLVSFVGPQTHRQLSELFNKAWVTVVPSYYESFCLVALEAMTCGCPVIASKTGGLKHTVIHGKTGLHVEPQNPMDLARVLNFLLANKQLREKMSRQAALHGKQFAWEIIASKTVDIYKDVIRCSRVQNTKNISWRQIWTEHLSAIGIQHPSLTV